MQKKKKRLERNSHRNGEKISVRESMEGVDGQQGHLLQMGQLRSTLKGPIELMTRTSIDTLKRSFSGVLKSDAKH